MIEQSPSRYIQTRFLPIILSLSKDDLELALDVASADIVVDRQSGSPVMVNSDSIHLPMAGRAVGGR